MKTVLLPRGQEPPQSLITSCPKQQMGKKTIKMAKKKKKKKKKKYERQAKIQVVRTFPADSYNFALYNIETEKD